MRNETHQIVATLFTLALLLTFSAVAAAQDCCCAQCGCHCSCHKVCRLVVEEKKVEVVCWGCSCEDFCVPGCSKLCCTHCQMVCQNCGENADPKVCAQPKPYVWRDWIPCCACIYTKTKLMKGTTTVKVPSYKWVTEDLCDNCAAAVPKEPGGESLPTPTAK